MKLRVAPSELVVRLEPECNRRNGDEIRVHGDEGQDTAVDAVELCCNFQLGTQ